MKRIRILLVDDSPAFRMGAKLFLTSDPGYEIVGQASSGADAIQQVSQLHPDLVLMDLKMPGMDGLEATRRIKTQPGAPNIVIVSLHDNSAYVEAAANAGADGFVSKAEFSALFPVLCDMFS
ncbi:MAG TPA: response regulator transcription factor [Abditibacteriaceae bacterium]|nr:response regulator transcription factor [Abditibacteriaceae bacterium]